MIRAMTAMSLILVAILTGAGCGRGASPSTSCSTAPAENYGDVIVADAVVDIDP